MSIARRFLLAGLSVLFLVGIQTYAKAEEEGSGLWFCAYNGSFCTYTDGSYWSGCLTGYTSGYVWTFVANTMCTSYTPKQGAGQP